MPELRRTDPYYGVFQHSLSDGQARLKRHPAPPPTLPDPRTGRALRIATVEVSGAICPACERHAAERGFVSFEADLRMVYACPHCCDLVWINGA
jgi:hypothetical protein